MIRWTRTRVLNSAQSRPFPPPIQRCRRGPVRCFSSLPRLSPAVRVYIAFHNPSHLPSAKLLPPFSSHSRSRRRSLPRPMEPSDDSSVVSETSSAEDYVHVSEPAADEPAPNPNLAAQPVLDSGILSEASSGGGSGGGEGSAEEGAAEGKRVLPDEMAKGVLFLQCESSAEGGSCDVYLVGTAHVSQESCKEVQAIISYLKPQVVFLELCSSRVAILTPQNLQVAHKLEVFPGSEFRVAFEEAMSYGGKVILGDRPVQITLRRTWGKMTLWHRAKFLYYILFQTIFLPSPDDLNKMLKEMDDVDMLTLFIQEMSKAFPTLMETLLHERDMYMSSTLLKVAREHSSVVAVVGKGHLSGIKKNWEQPIEIKRLLEIPTQSVGPSRTKIIASIGVALTGVATAIYLLGKR
ncbi:TraB family [Musa troglodytarum]|uniref:TraB family n=1 Tax=Musa troglodytarum TaxID=320322 RepID=A0A9E7E7F0_9LILI|nr:TraB family [Musa troglodytarum]